MLLTGSRQSMFGFAITFLISDFYIKFKYKLIISILIVGFFSTINYSNYINMLFNFSVKHNIHTVTRFLYKLENGDSRVSIYTDFFSKLELYPQFTSFKIESGELPHNFFMEYAYICGGIFGFLFFIYIIRTIYLMRNNGMLFRLLLFYFVPFMVSSGLAAAKYFIFILIINILYLSYGKRKNTFSNIKLQ